MGGAVGSIKHIWDVEDFSFNELLDVFSGVLEGTVEASEKTDGFPIVWRWTGSEIMWARSSSDVRLGGFTTDEMLISYGSHPAYGLIEAGLRFANENFAPRLEGMEPFYHWIDSELFSPHSAQFVRSSYHGLISHRAFIVKGEENEALAEAEENPFGEVMDRIGSIKTEGRDEWGKPVTWFGLFTKDLPPKLRKGSGAREVIGEIESGLIDFLRGSGVDMDSTINDWVYSVSVEHLTGRLGKENLEGERGEGIRGLVELVSEVIANPDASNANSNLAAARKIIKKDFPEVAEAIPAKKGEVKKLRKEILKPLAKELKIQGAKFIRQLQPTMIDPEDYEDVRNEMREGITTAIKLLDTAEDKDSKRTIATAAQKVAEFGGYQDLISPYEGFVLRRGDDLVKVTGTFYDFGTVAKAGRILDDGVVPVNWETADKVISYFPIGAKPAHAGHWDMIEGISKVKVKNPVTGKPADHEVVVLVSKGGRERPGEFTIGSKENLTYWNVYLKNKLPRNVRLATPEELLSSVIYLTKVESGRPDVFAIWIWSGEKDAGRFEHIETNERVSQPSQSKAEAALGRPTTNISGTRMRQFLSEGDKESFMAHLPAPLSDQEREEVWALFTE